MEATRPPTIVNMGSLAAILVLAAASVQGDLYRYVSRPDPAFSYRVVSEQRIGGGALLQVNLVSQKWQGIVWAHALHLVRPARPAHADAAVLVIGGGSNRRRDRKLRPQFAATLLAYAVRLGCTIAVLEQVPNQPLYDGLYEDALIAHTFSKYLQTGNEDWPLLFPMVKSVVRAMDAIDALGIKQFGGGVRRFCVAGASKRGWTTWLTAAADPRVVAIAPQVIDTLNFKPQMAHQIASWGKFSEKIEDYTRLQLQKMMLEHPRGPALARQVDPYEHRRRIVVPKLILIGTNDRYWPVDAARFYFGDLIGQSYLHYVPNRGHGLGGREILPIGAFFGRVLDGKPLPGLVWRFEENDREATATVLPGSLATRAELWTARTATRDFRSSRWTSVPLRPGRGGIYRAVAKRPQGRGHLAFFVQVHFGDLAVSTRLMVVGTRPKTPVAGKGEAPASSPAERKESAGRGPRTPTYHSVRR